MRNVSFNQYKNSLLDQFELFFNKIDDLVGIINYPSTSDSNNVDFVLVKVNSSFKNNIGSDVEGEKIKDVFSENYLQIRKDLIQCFQNNEILHSNFVIIKKELQYHVTLVPINNNTIQIILKDARKSIKSENIDVFSYKKIRGISTVILTERQEDRLLQNICTKLSDSLGSIIWITRNYKNTNVIKKIYCSDENFVSQYDQNTLQLKCMEGNDLNVYPNISFVSCNNQNLCEFHKYCKNQSRINIPLVFNESWFGMLNIPGKTNIENEEYFKSFLQIIGNDIAYALFNIEINEELEIARKKVRNYYIEIDEQNKKLRELNKTLENKNSQLLLAVAKSKECEKLKSTFLANVSHEIRTPLNGILGFTQLLKIANYTPEKIEEYLDIITFSGNQLLSTINNILDISKLESGQLSVNMSKCNLENLLNEIYNSNKFKLSKNGHVSFSVKTDVVINENYFYTDEIKLQQILNILIDNSFKFTKKGFVKVGINVVEDSLVFYVEDTGIGISKDKYNLIFETFRQSDESNTREYGGIGLGLPIARGLVKLLKGEIWLESELEKGTTVFVKLPYNRENNAKQEDFMDLDKIETLDWSLKKILIVEDDSFSAEYLTEVLSITGVQLYYAKNGNEAIEKVKDMPDLDIVLMDIQLPGLSGDKATKVIRGINSEIPIIAQTAHAMVNDKENYIKAGCNDYISKPIAVQELFSIICKYI